MANPPVCRIMDYGKFRYEESQKAKESRKKTIQVSIKEVKFRPKIGKGDFDTKVRHMQDFLEEGHKVKVTLQFRGREMAHPELGSKILDAVIEKLGPTAKVEAYARLEGRNMTMVLAPEKKIVKKESREERREAKLAEAAANAPADQDSDDATDDSADGAATSTDTTTADTTDDAPAFPEAHAPEVHEPEPELQVVADTDTTA